MRPARSWRHACAGGVLVILCSACFGGFDQPEPVSLSPYPLSMELPAGFEPTRVGARLVLANPEDARVVTVVAAGPGGDASTRSAAEVLAGAELHVDWTRPHTFDGLTGTETRVTQTAPEARTHWIAAIDTASGVVFVDVAIDADVSTSPSGDVLWAQARDSIRRR